MQINKASLNTTNSSSFGRSRRYTKKTGVMTPAEAKMWEETELASPIVLQKSVSTNVNIAKETLRSPVVNTPKGIKRKKKDSSSSKL